MSKRLLDKEKATINPGGNLDLSILFIRLLGHQQLGCPQFDKVLLFTMTLSYPILGLVVLFPTIVLSLPSSLNPYSDLTNLSASPLNIVRTLPQSCSVSNIPGASGRPIKPRRLGWRSELYDCCWPWNTELSLYFRSVRLHWCTSKVGRFIYE